MKCWSFSFSCTSALDRLAPAIAVSMNPKLSGIMCTSAINDSWNEPACSAIFSMNAAKKLALNAIMNIAPAP